MFFKWWLSFIIMTIATTTLAGNCFSAQQDNTKIVRSEIRVKQTGNVSRYILIKPKNHDLTENYPLFIFMHGRGSSPEKVLKNDYSLLTRQDVYILLPEAPERYNDGFSWYRLTDRGQLIADLERDERIIKQMIEEVTAANNIDPSRITLS